MVMRLQYAVLLHIEGGGVQAAEIFKLTNGTNSSKYESTLAVG